VAVGVESDRLVFDYLSRVGDLAQVALPAADRMRLVAQLRNDIERARGDADNPAAVQRILGRFGSPDEVVEAAAGTAGASGASGAASGRTAPPTAEPPPGSYGPFAKSRTARQARREEAPRQGEAPRGKPAGDDDAEVPPQRRGRGAGGGEPDWWSGGLGEPRLRAGDEVAGLPGMTGGIFIPFDDEELTGKEPPPLPGALAGEREAVEGTGAGEAVVAEPPAVARRGGLRALLRRGAGAGAGVRGWGSPVLLLCAALLVAGAVIGSWVPLGLGWLCGYFTRTLTRTQAKFAVLVIPGATAVGLAVWLWGRNAGKWSTPVPQGHMGQAVQDALPATVRIAAVASALYLFWRARRSA
jgi:hypothetical protein